MLAAKYCTYKFNMFEVARTVDYGGLQARPKWTSLLALDAFQVKMSIHELSSLQFKSARVWEYLSERQNWR